MTRLKFLMRLAAYGLAIVVLFLLCLSWLGFASSAGEIGKHFRRTVSTATGFCLTCKLNEIDPKLPFVKALTSETVEDILAAKATAFGESHRLQILVQGDQFEYTLYAGGERLVLFKTAATLEGLNQAAALLNVVIDSKIAQMAISDHHTLFSQQNESVEKQSAMVGGKIVVTDHVVLARKPHLNELYGIEAALKHSLPSNRGPGETGIKFYFLQEQLTAESKDAAAYFIYRDKDGRTAIYVTPGALDKLWVTEADAPTWAVNQRTTSAGVYYDTIESLMMHELAHNHQSRMGWDDSDRVKLTAMAERTGFVLASEEGVTVYLIKVKVGTAIELFRLEDGIDHTGGRRWFRSNSTGQFLNEQGLVVSTKVAAKMLTNDQVMAAALVAPASKYFDTAFEIEAEAIKLYRLGGQSRRLLLYTSPQLYQLAKDEDQSEIDQFFGTVHVNESRVLNKQNQSSPLPDIQRDEPVLIRSWDGTLVPFSSANAGEIKRQEILATNQPQQ